MARLGEGDDRWIVKERQDGTNVNQWHWTEKDISGWTKQRLNELLGGLDLFSNKTGSARTASVESVEGDSVINVRKSKLIATYELGVTVSFTGRAGDPVKEVSGRISLPYISEENHDEDPEMRVLPSEEGPAAAAVKQGILGNRKVIYDAVAQFVKELRAGGPVRPGAAESTATAAKPADSSARPQAATATPAAMRQPEQKASAPKPEAKARSAPRGGDGATQSLQLEERFHARPADLFEALTDERRLRAFTQAPAAAEPRPGGAFSLYDGGVRGSFVELEPPRRIVQDWRFSSWPQDASSRVTITLEEPDPGSTILKLQQTGIPREDRFGNGDVLDTTEQGWQRQIFSRIHSVFGF